MQDCILRSTRSALSQTDKQIEVIVVDNQSSDRTYEIAQSIQDTRLKVFRNETNVGAYGNHNRCLEHATGEWVKFLHGDDELLPNCIEEFRKAVAVCPRETALIGCGAVQYDQQNCESGRTFVPQNLVVMKAAPPRSFILQGNIFGTPTMTMVHRERLLAIGAFDLGMEPAADGDCWINLRTYFPSAALPQYLVIVRDDPPSNLAKRARAASRWCKHTFRQIQKWHRLDTELASLPLDQTVFGDWICRETFRYWEKSLLYAGVGRIGPLCTLLRELRQQHIIARSFCFYARRRFQGKTSTSFRSEHWPGALSELLIQPVAK